MCRIHRSFVVEIFWLESRWNPRGCYTSQLYGCSTNAETKRCLEVTWLFIPVSKLRALTPHSCHAFASQHKTALKHKPRNIRIYAVLKDKVILQGLKLILLGDVWEICYWKGHLKILMWSPLQVSNRFQLIQRSHMFLFSKNNDSIAPLTCFWFFPD